MDTTRRSALSRACLGILAGAALLTGAAVHAQAWPTRPVKIVVPFAPGGATDVVARMLGQRLSEKWGQTVVIENRSGAGGNTGTDLVAKSAPDGYTLVMASGSITINPNIYAKMPFDTKKDLVPITNVANGPMLFVVGEKSPYRSVRDVIEAAKAKPGALSFGSSGVGGQVHLSVENFADAAGIELQHVPYKGEAPAYTDLIAGQTQLMIGNIGAAGPLVSGGRLRALAVTGARRSPLFPDVPTVSESGLPGFTTTGWFGLLAPAGTPADVVAKIHRDSAAALDETEIKARLYVLGMAPVASSPGDFARQMDAELDKWAQIARKRKLVAN